MSELVVQVGDRGDRMACASAAMRFAERAGARRKTVQEIGLCVAELVSNVERYARVGSMAVRLVRDEEDYIEIVVADGGPGIDDVGAAQQDGWSCGRKRELGEPVGARSLGVGLGTVVRAMDRVSFESFPGHGTRVVARKRLR